MADEFEATVPVKMIEITLVAGKQIVDAQHLVTARKQPVDQMRAEETCSAGDQYAPTTINLTCYRCRCFL